MASVSPLSPQFVGFSSSCKHSQRSLDWEAVSVFYFDDVVILPNILIMSDCPGLQMMKTAQSGPWKLHQTDNLWRFSYSTPWVPWWGGVPNIINKNSIFEYNSIPWRTSWSCAMTSSCLCSKPTSVIWYRAWAWDLQEQSLLILLEESQDIQCSPVKPVMFPSLLSNGFSTCFALIPWGPSSLFHPLTMGSWDTTRDYN